MSRSRIIVIDAGALFTPAQKIAPARLVLEGDRIAEAGSPAAIRIPAGAERIDASRFRVTPGFIDPHIHGSSGVDVMNATYDSLNSISKALARHGTTSFLPTTVSSPPEVLADVLERLGLLISRQFDGAKPLGVHLEGPFINPSRRGTHKSSNITAPDASLLERWIRISGDSVRLLTVAPELEGIEPLLLVSKDFGITVGMGHSEASWEVAAEAANSGICYAVHTFNAMRPLTHRDPGIAGVVLSDDRIFAEIIADGIHIHPAIVRLFARAKGSDRILLATDAISAADMPDGRYVLGTDTVEVVRGACRDTDGRLAGSTLTQELALRNFIEWTGFEFEESLLGLTLNPARALKLDRKGRLEPGADADLVILDEDFRVVKTIVGGQLVYEWTN